MKHRALRWTSLALTGLLGACGAGDEAEQGASDEAAVEAPAPNTLTADEMAAGWQLLFDGNSTDGWRGYGRPDVPSTWVVVEGELTHPTEGGDMDGGDLLTVEEFTDFDLTFDFKVGSVGNSGVFYRVREAEGKGLWEVAPEYQVLDDPAYPATDDWQPTKHLTGENYDLHAAVDRIVHPAGEWNTGRILVEGSHVEHWLNGRMTVSYEYYSPEWEALVAASKFSAEDYARAPSGAIALQDHGTPVWYRNIKIRRIGDG